MTPDGSDCREARQAALCAVQHLGGVEGVGDAVLLLLDLPLAGAAHLDHCDAAAQLCQPLLQLLPASTRHLSYQEGMARSSINSPCSMQAVRASRLQAQPQA